LIVFVRAPLAGPTADALAIARRRDLPVLADFDDLVFRPDLFSPVFMDGITYLSTEDQAAYLGGIHGYRSMVQAVDGVVVSTNSLASEVLSSGGRSAWVVPNVFNYSSEALARYLRFRRFGTPPERVVIGYASGTLTHQRDFEEAREALVEALRKRPHARLRIVGDFDAQRVPLADDILNQVEFDPRLRTLGEMPYVYSQFDIAIAPLQTENPFTDAKSNLKFLDAALVGCPTIASPTRTYAELAAGLEILLAKDASQWFEALIELIDGPERRRSIAEAALARVGMDFSPAAHLQGVSRAIEGISAIRARQRTSIGKDRSSGTKRANEPELSWVLPEPDCGSGGARSIFRLASKTRELGIESTVYVTPTGAGNLGAELLSSEYRVEVTDDLSSIPTSSRPVATQWTTAIYIANSVRTQHRPVYFIQDYEPLFYPMSYDYVRAESTYRLPFHHVYYGPWVGGRVGGSPRGRSTSLSFPVEQAYRSSPYAARRRSPREIAWLARPGMDRRCHDFALEVLSAVTAEAADVIVNAFGSRYLDVGNSGINDLGVLDNFELAQLYERSTLGVTISTTNPSAVPYEMASCGCIPVDLGTDVSASTYRGMDEVPLLLELDPYTAARQILSLLADERSVARRRKRALKAAGDLPSVRQVSQKFVTFIGSLRK
jgi:glycosyltransferase involved in cell wall biosynthesis